MLGDININIGYDEKVNCWYLEAFEVRQYLSVHVPLHPYGAWNYVKIRRKDFLDAGKRARKLLNQKLVEMGILSDKN